MSFLIIANNISQYHSPIYKLLPKNFTVGCLSVIGVESVVNPITGSTQLLDKYFYEGIKIIYYKNRSPLYSGFWSRVNFKIIFEVMFGKWPKVMVHGHSNFTNVMILLLGHLPYVKVYWRGESVISKKRNQLNIMILKLLTSSISGALYSHQKNKEFLLSIGVDEHKLFFAPTCVDVDFFNKNVVHEGQKSFIFVGKFIERKNILPIMKEFIRQNRKDDIEIVLIGGGHLQKELMELANSTDYNFKIKIYGFLSQHEIKNLLSVASILFLPSKFDSSPKVVHEAIASCVPVVISNGVHTASELSNINSEVVKVVELGPNFTENFVETCYKLHKHRHLISYDSFIRLNELYSPKNWIKGLKQLIKSDE